MNEENQTEEFKIYVKDINNYLIKMGFIQDTPNGFIWNNSLNENFYIRIYIDNFNFFNERDTHKREYKSFNDFNKLLIHINKRQITLNKEVKK